LKFASIAQYRIDLNDIAGYASKDVNNEYKIYIYRKSAEAYAELNFKTEEDREFIIKNLDRILSVKPINLL
jgi:hypothetical protein